MISPVAAAQTVRPPEALVLQVSNFFGYSTNYQTDINVTWKLSPDDTDQVNGAFDYRFNYNESVGVSWISPVSYNPVPGRPGWVWSTIGPASWTEGQSDPLLARNYTVQARNPAGNESAFSCQTNLSIVTPPHNPYRFSQCGQLDITQPRGMGLLTANVSTDGESRYTITSKYQTSLSDPDDGTYEYWRWYATQEPFTNEQVQTFHSVNFVEAPVWLFNQSIPATTALGNGVYQWSEDFVQTPGVSQPFFSGIVAVDTRTHERSILSCVATTATDVLFAGSACGNVTVVASEASQGVTIPLIGSPSAIVSATNLTEAQVGYIYGGLVVVGLAAMGFAAGGPITAAAGVLAAIPLLYLLGILPAWSILLMVFGAGGIVVLRRQSGGMT